MLKNIIMLQYSHRGFLVKEKKKGQIANKDRDKFYLIFYTM